MDQQILKRLKELEKEKHVKVLFAVESGSRAWGFASTNSDWDIRFIYVHKLPYYLSTQELKDNIEFIEGDLDFQGWELRKALKLLAKGNPPMLEWLDSPIKYVEDKTFSKELFTMASNCFSPKTAIYHYMGMAKRNYNQYIKGKSYVKLKKYLYVIRPLLSCMAVQDSGSMAPTLMSASMPLLKPFKAYSEVVQLLERKKAGEELDEEPAINVLNDFIEESLFFFELYVQDAKSANIDYNELNKLLYKEVLKFDKE